MRGFGERLQIVGVVTIRDTLEPPPKAEHVEVERRVSAERRYRGHPRLEECADGEPEQIVDPTSNYDLSRRSTVHPRDFGAERSAFRISVVRDAAERGVHGLERARRRNNLSF